MDPKLPGTNLKKKGCISPTKEEKKGGGERIAQLEWKESGETFGYSESG